MDGRDLLLARMLGVLQRRFRLLCRRSLLAALAHLTRVRDPALRGRSLLRRLAGEPAAVAAEKLYLLERLAAARHEGAQEVFLALLDERLVREVLPAGLLEDIWRIGRVRGYQRMLELFFYTSGADRRLDDTPRLPPDIRDIPLGVRKSMARSGHIFTLERLLADNDAGVIRNLLANPRLTEREVVRLAARRPGSVVVLTEIAAHRGWISRYAVRKALVWNPATPVSIALPLLKYLLRGDLEELAGYSAVNEVLRRAARRLLEAGGGERAEGGAG